MVHLVTLFFYRTTRHSPKEHTTEAHLLRVARGLKHFLRVEGKSETY